MEKGWFIWPNRKHSLLRLNHSQYYYHENTVLRRASGQAAEAGIAVTLELWSLLLCHLALVYNQESKTTWTLFLEAVKVLKSRHSLCFHRKNNERGENLLLTFVTCFSSLLVSEQKLEVRNNCILQPVLKSLVWFIVIENTVFLHRTLKYIWMCYQYLDT